jgi:hypothetical protein
MNRVEAAATNLTSPNRDTIEPLATWPLDTDPTGCTPAVWRAVTRTFVTEREFVQAIANGHPDLAIRGFLANIRPTTPAPGAAPSGGVSITALVDAAESLV